MEKDPWVAPTGNQLPDMVDTSKEGGGGARVESLDKTTTEVWNFSSKPILLLLCIVELLLHVECKEYRVFCGCSLVIMIAFF